MRIVNLESLKYEIVNEINSGRSVEELYRENKNIFQKAFNAVYDDLKEVAAAQFWYERLNYSRNDFFLGNRSDILFLGFCSILAGLVANIPNFFGITTDNFFQKNISYVVLPVLMIYFSRKNSMKFSNMLLPLLFILFSNIYINLFPNTKQSDTFLLACIHLPLFLWIALGYVFIGGDLKNEFRKTDFLRWNGNILVMISILVLSGALFSGIIVGLFNLIGHDIIEFYIEHIAIWGLAAIPVVASHLVYHRPQLVNSISPIIAKIFTPLVFFALLIFSGAMIFSEVSVYHDRNFLIMFNILLIAVIAIILYSLTEADKHTQQQINHWFLFGAAVLTIILNAIALSAIVFRLTEFGVTPNRIAVLGANILIFIHLLRVTHQLFKVIRLKSDVQDVEGVITSFMPFYGIWVTFVTFILPMLFSFT